MSPLAVIVLSAALLGSTDASAEQTLASPVPRCHTPGLHVYFAGSNGAAGRIETDIVFRNISGHTCFVYGYPGLGLENARHRVLPSRVVWGSTFARHDQGRHRVVLAPGRAAVANLAWSDVPHGRGGDCVSAAYLEVTPPDERAFRRLRFPQVACDHGMLTATALSARRTSPRAGPSRPAPRSPHRASLPPRPQRPSRPPR